MRCWMRSGNGCGPKGENAFKDRFRRIGRANDNQLTFNGLTIHDQETRGFAGCSDRAPKNWEQPRLGKANP
jgi:hypothetical protein